MRLSPLGCSSHAAISPRKARACAREAINATGAGFRHSQFALLIAAGCARGKSTLSGPP